MRKVLNVLVIAMFVTAMFGAAMHVHEGTAPYPLQVTCKICQLSATPAMPGVAPSVPSPQLSEKHIESPVYVAAAYLVHVLDNSPNRSPPA